MNKPLVTVAIPLYNHEKYIEQCLKSIVSQDYPNIELIVIDDGSPDNSYQVAKVYLESQNKLTNYILKTRKNKGLCNTLNEIIDLSSGIYFSGLGSDDCWKPEKVSDHVNFLEENSDVTLVHSNAVVVDGENNEGKVMDFSKKVNSGFIYEDFIYRRGGINVTSVSFRTSVFKDIGKYDPSFRFEDTDFFLRLTKNHKIGFINKVHTYYRRHNDNMSHSKNKLLFMSQELLRIYEKNIDNPRHKKFLVLRVYKKATESALKTFDIKNVILYLTKYWRLKLFNSGLSIKGK